MANITVVGAGLAGAEAAYQLCRRGHTVTLREMKPEKRSPAHQRDTFAELVCSNSLRSDRLENAVGLLKEELRVLDSLILSCADETRVPAGGALAVDREGFTELVTKKLLDLPNLTYIPGEVTDIPDGPCVIATGPLTSGALYERISDFFQGLRRLPLRPGGGLSQLPHDQGGVLRLLSRPHRGGDGGAPLLRDPPGLRGLHARGGHGQAG